MSQLGMCSSRFFEERIPAEIRRLLDRRVGSDEYGAVGRQYRH